MDEAEWINEDNEIELVVLLQVNVYTASPDNDVVEENYLKRVILLAADVLLLAL